MDLLTNLRAFSSATEHGSLSFRQPAPCKLHGA